MPKNPKTPRLVPAQRSRPVTIGDVARLGGVSQAAVSRAFSPGASISAALREKVMSAAQQIGYRPSMIARSLTTRRSNVIAVAISRLTNHFHAQLLESLSIRLGRLGYRILLFMSEPEMDTDPIMDEVIRNRVDAVILASVELSSHFADQCFEAGISTIMINRKTESATVSTVTGDNFHGGRTVASFLVAGGHQRFAYLAGNVASSTSRDREEGYRSFLEGQGTGISDRGIGNYNFNLAKDAARRLFRAATPPDALFCANDHMALAALDVAVGEFSMMVGKDVSIVGFDGSQPAEWSMIGLSTYVQSAERIAQQTVTLLQEMIDTPTASQISQVVGGELIVRRSARLPAQGLVQHRGQTVWRLARRTER